MEKITPKKLDEIRNAGKNNTGNCIKVGMSTCGIAAGADEVFDVLTKEVERQGLDVSVKMCGCAGMCYAEPLVEVCIEGMPKAIYGTVNKKVALDIIEKHVLGKYLLNDHIFKLKVK